MTQSLVNRADHEGAPAGDAAFARWLASRAGDLLLSLRAEMGHRDMDALRAAGDARAHEFIVGALARYRPADAVLSEEGKDDPSRLAADRVWIVDPLDGTREFGEEGRADWAVHIGLWQRTGQQSGKLAAGAVALPAQHRVLATGAAAPPYPPLSHQAAAGGRLRLAASRTRPPAFLSALAEDLGAELVPMGSAGAKIATVIDGDVDAYVHAGGQYEWDSAAPVAVATATGLHTSRLDGSGLEYNRPNPLLADLVVCRKDLAPRLLAALARRTG
ncbi:3'(2'),5'-bisphosphate nucleotidase CysQ [Planosporangium flavigriseum]|uniref:3'(2'),5'-bisphosphate nucleotidase CysQ n=1 Tax=Planosporangium flavigriseum TaxID=373681 RepID=A0A8J3LQP0_9ACTN|nr:3'(2'),5'-bisphosphate nucleotidase CysQ [Planosporangium flavigriseum]NJC63522.1 3'(2'),5'-bisphosphate nucleotidase CysQ [Planosporangium flavigriseum]GIG72219.1 3'(2'),5'-bisphosphate nucleotidase CysQ [Planosporangium flavigriseum]